MAPRSKKPRLPTEEEMQLWQVVTRHDAKLPQSGIADIPSPVSNPRRFIPLVSHHFAPPMPSFTSNTQLTLGAYAGIDRNTADRFRKGDYPIDATLDLHGMTREKAHHALTQFIKSHHDHASRCLLVITGKGKSGAIGVLRETLPHWLEEPGIRAMILAYDSAKPKHGGSGAYYILLRRRR